MAAAVQHRSTFATTVTSLSLAYLSNNAAANLLAYGCGGGIGGSPLSASTDNNTNIIANATNITGAASSGSSRVDYVASSNSGANTVTAHTGTGQDLHLHLWEISGCVTASPVRATGTVTTNATGSVATTTATPLTGDAVIGFFMDRLNSDAMTAGAGFSPSELTQDVPDGTAALSEFLSATSDGTQTATCGGNGTNVLSQSVVVFSKASSSGVQATTTTPYIGIWSKDGVLYTGAFDVGIPINFGLYDDDFVAQFSGTTVGATATGVTSVPVGLFSKDATLVGAFDA